MIGWVKGKVLRRTDGRMLVAVTEGVGLELLIAETPEARAISEGDRVELSVHTHVREDAIELFGFVTPLEKALFHALHSVSGVGPRSALHMLSLGSAALSSAILHRDTSALTAVPGVGKKTAERVLLELSETLLKKLQAAGQTLPNDSAETANGEQRQSPARPTTARAAFRDAHVALLGLGYRDAEVTAALDRVLTSSSDAAPTATPPRPEDVIKRALRELQAPL